MNPQRHKLTQPALCARVLVAVAIFLGATTAPTWASRAANQCPGLESASSWRQAYERGLAAFAQRADGAIGSRAMRGPVEQAAACHRLALAAAPERFEVRVALLQTLLFHGEYAAQSDDERRRLFLEGRDLFEESYTALGEVIGKKLRDLSPQALRRAVDGCTQTACREARPLFFLGALHWGLWADYFGNMAALRKGVAGRIRRLAEITLELTPMIDEGGAHRLMGRLHFLAPRVPFITSWVSRRRALQELEMALAKGPEDPLNMTFLAEAALSVAKDREWARRLLESAARSMPRQGHEIEDRYAIERAQELRRKLRL